MLHIPTFLNRVIIMITNVKSETTAVKNGKHRTFQLKVVRFLIWRREPDGTNKQKCFTFYQNNNGF